MGGYCPRGEIVWGAIVLDPLTPLSTIFELCRGGVDSVWKGDSSLFLMTWTNVVLLYFSLIFVYYFNVFQIYG